MDLFFPVLLRLMLSTLFFVVAWYALRADNFSQLLGDVAEQVGRPRGAFNNVLAYRERAQKVFYVFGALFFLFAWTFLYHHMRALKIEPARGIQPYSAAPAGNGNGAPYTSSGLAPGATTQPRNSGAYGGATPYGGAPAQQNTGQQQAPGGVMPYGR